MTLTPVSPKSVEFWFDPICPWCWMTSRWATEVAETRGFEIQWHPFSLQVLNEPNDDSAPKQAHSLGLRVVRVIEAARQAHGDGVVAPLYTAAGTRIHPGGRTDTEQVIAEMLEETGLPAELADAVNGEGDVVEDALRRNVAEAMEMAGPDVGIPIISIDGVAFFGPVVSPAPTGDDALKLWDGIYAAASVPGFFELKRGRKVGPQF